MTMLDPLLKIGIAKFFVGNFHARPEGLFVNDPVRGEYLDCSHLTALWDLLSAAQACLKSNR